MSSHNSDTCNLEKGGIMANSEHKLWLPEVTSPGHQPPMTRQKSELGLVRSAQFSRESKSPDLCMVYKCWQYIPKKCFSKHFVSQTKHFSGQRVTSELHSLAILVEQTLLCVEYSWARPGSSVVCWKDHAIYRQTDLGFEFWLHCWPAT